MSGKKILVIGSSNTDMSVCAAKLPCPGETVLGTAFRMGAGGKGANQAVAARRLGGDVAFVCKVGRDMFGEQALDGYRACGLDVSHVMLSDKPSGVALITVDTKAENSIVVASGANADVSAQDIDSIADVVTGASILLMQLEIPMPAVERAARIAHDAGVKVVLNPAPAAALPESLLSCVDLIIPNETEVSAITGIEVNDEETAVMQAECGPGHMGGAIFIPQAGSISRDSGKQENWWGVELWTGSNVGQTWDMWGIWMDGNQGIGTAWYGSMYGRSVRCVLK